MAQGFDYSSFEALYSGLSKLQHKGLVTRQPPQLKKTFLREVMPAILSLGREPYSCRGVLHPNMDCKTYCVDKMARAFLNGMKLCLFAQLVPAIARYRKQLFSSDSEQVLKAAHKILKGFLRATLFICLGIGLPFVTVCVIPLRFAPGKSFLTTSYRIALTYALLPCAALIVEEPTRIASYMGFFFSKALSLAWALLKNKKVVR